MKKIISGITVECVSGDISSQSDITAVVNAANAQLQTGGGVAGVLHMAAGPDLEDECRLLAPIKPGEAVITGAHNLPNKYVIHCLGPVFGVDRPEDELLASCYRNALRLAEQYRIDSVAFPAISTGIFGYPMEDAAAVAFNTIREMLPKLNHLKRIRFVLYGEKAAAIHEQYLEKAFNAL